ncbi:unnamed protein product [Paramecium primaurelia]|uniref:Uncharacterized protein n=2 Tax=Paramecium TaxID=5884 RepID=A0A8S1TGP3_9CILI|nr:unnamed protein product [Paramecium primaurelia]CAD8150923.1 unnamed protein product [Paramecium pentaurelia]
MISLIKGIWQKYFDPPVFKILIIGLDGAGKTTLLNKLKQLAKHPFIQFDKIPKTVGLNITEIDYMASNKSINKKYKVTYWDLGGSQTQRSIWKKYYGECHGIIFVVDGNKSERWDEVRNCFNDKAHDQVPILILVNNRQNRDSGICIKIKELIQNNTDRFLNIQEVNIVDNTNVVESVKLLHNEIGQLFQLYN